MSTEPDEDERRIQRALRDRVTGRGRPAPAPAAPPPPADDERTDPADPAEPDEPDDVQEEEQDEAPAPAPAAGPPPTGRTRAARAAALTGDGRGVALLYSGAAGVLGYWGLGLRGPLFSALDTADHAPTGTLALELAIAAALIAWRLVRWCLPTSLPARLGAATVATAVGPFAAPYAAAAAVRHSIDPAAASLVLTAAALLAVLWAADRRTRAWWPPLAWACRIPAASAVLAVSLYGTH